MALSVVATNTSATNECTVPASAATGDLLIGFQLSNDGPSSDSIPTGWTKYTEQTWNASPPQIDRLAVLYKVSDGTEASSTVAFSGTGSDTITVIAVVRGQDGNIFGGNSINVVTNTADSVTMTELTPPVANCLLMLVGGRFHATPQNVNTYSIATSNPTWTEIADFSDGGLSLGVAHALRPETTATGTATIQWAGGAVTSERAGIFLAIKPENVVDMDSGDLSLSGGATTALIFDVDEATISLSGAATLDSRGGWSNQSKSSTSWTNQDKS